MWEFGKRESKGEGIPWERRRPCQDPADAETHNARYTVMPNYHATPELPVLSSSLHLTSS